MRFAATLTSQNSMTPTSSTGQIAPARAVIPSALGAGLHLSRNQRADTINAAVARGHPTA